MRFLAIIGVIAIHVFQGLSGQNQIFHFKIYGFCEIVRYSVPIFLMLSGALLLNRGIEIEFFIKHRLVRIIYPFIFYLMLLFFVGLALNNPISNNIFSQYWYFWLIIGVYLSIPIINKFIQQASMKEIEYFLAVFVIGSIFYQCVLVFKFEQYFDLNFFVAPLGYLILGYYLSIKDFKINPKKLVLLSFLIFVGVTIFKILAVGDVIPEKFILDYSATQSKILGSWIDVSIFEILQASSLFLFFKNLYENEGSHFKGFLQINAVKKGISSVSRASYGMYLCEIIFRRSSMPFFKSLHSSGVEVCLTIILMVIVISALSWVVVRIFSLIGITRRFSGYY